MRLTIESGAHIRLHGVMGGCNGVQVHRAVSAILEGWQARHVLGSGDVWMLRKLSSAFQLLFSWSKIAVTPCHSSADGAAYTQNKAARTCKSTSVHRKGGRPLTHGKSCSPSA